MVYATCSRRFTFLGLVIFISLWERVRLGQINRTSHIPNRYVQVDTKDLIINYL